MVSNWRPPIVYFVRIDTYGLYTICAAGQARTVVSSGLGQHLLYDLEPESVSMSINRDVLSKREHINYGFAKSFSSPFLRVVASFWAATAYARHITNRRKHVDTKDVHSYYAAHYKKNLPLPSHNA